MKNGTYTDDYPKFLKLLDKRGVEYLLIGAYAVMSHTKVPRATKGMDAWYRQTEENAERPAAALRDFTGKNIYPEALLKKRQTIELKSADFKIEIRSSREALDFDDAWPKRKIDTVGGIKLNVISKKI